MLTGAAVCPHPPLLIPEATGAPGPGDARLDRLRAACRRAVAGLLGDHPDLVAVVGAAPHTAQYPPGAPASLHEFGVPFTVGDAGPASPEGVPVLPLALTIGKWLLAPAACPVPAVWWGIASDAPAAECLRLGEKLAGLAPRVGLLILGDGSGRRARQAPGAVDPDADRYDDQVAAALAGADAAALAALDPGADAELYVAGRAAWQVLAGAAGGDAFTGDLLCRAMPFEVTYLVARWRRR